MTVMNLMIVLDLSVYYSEDIPRAQPSKVSQVKPSVWIIPTKR